MDDKERLINEWTEYGRVIIAVDFDDTISSWRHRSQKDCDKVIDLVKWCRTIGAYVMIHTSCDSDRYDEITSFCKEKGLEIDAINKNVIPLPYGNEGKPYFNWQLCDRSGLPYSMEVLEKAAKEVLTIKNSKNKPQDVG